MLFSSIIEVAKLQNLFLNFPVAQQKNVIERLKSNRQRFLKTSSGFKKSLIWFLKVLLSFDIRKIKCTFAPFKCLFTQKR